MGTKRQSLIEHGECLRSLLKLQKGPVEGLGRQWRARREPSEPAPQEIESSLFLMQVAGLAHVRLGQTLSLIIQAGGEPVELDRLFEPASVPRGLAQNPEAEGV